MRITVILLAALLGGCGLNTAAYQRTYDDMEVAWGLMPESRSWNCSQWERDPEGVWDRFKSADADKGAVIDFFNDHC